MDNDAVSNDIIVHNTLAYCCCTRCIQYWATGAYMFLGQVGCRFPDLNKTHLYDAWHVKQEKDKLHYRRCLRCWCKNSECCAPPDEMLDSLDEINGILTSLDTGKRTKRIANPDYRAPAQDEEAVEPRYIFEEYELTVADIMSLNQQLTLICRPLASTLNLDYKRQWECLYLHSGTAEEMGNFNSEVRPSGRKRDTKTIAVNVEVKKRGFENLVNQQLQEEEGGVGKSPKKSRRGVAQIDPDKERKRRREDLKTQLAALEALHASLTGTAKGQNTKSIKKLKDQISKL